MLTPIEKVNGIYIKRDDLFRIANVCGGKARTCWRLAQRARGLVTASSRHSPQALIVASIAKELNILSYLHMPSGAETEEMIRIRECGGVIIQHNYGYNTVIIKRAKEDALQKNFTYIPFGMECNEAVDETAWGVSNIPYEEIKRIVISVGSGMSLAGILLGLSMSGYNIPVLGIIVGADPYKRLDKYAPFFWRARVTLVKSKYKYSNRLENTFIGNILLDPVYEAKCLEYLEPGDLFWIIGNRNGSN